MTGFASDVDVGPARVESIPSRVVVLSHAGRMTVGAHEVPVLRRPGPMQLVVVRDVLGGVEMKPALAAVFLCTRVPRDRERLKSAVGKRDEVLLQRKDAERVFDLEVGQAP